MAKNTTDYCEGCGAPIGRTGALVYCVPCHDDTPEGRFVRRVSNGLERINPNDRGGNEEVVKRIVQALAKMRRDPIRS